MKTRLVINEEFNGLELYFTQKPTEDVLAMLRDAHWRYHRSKKCWYAKRSPANDALAQRISESNESVHEADDSVSSPEFFPIYAEVDGARIYRSSDLSFDHASDGYFLDIKAFLSVRFDRVIIIDLRDALIPGRECEQLSMYADSYDAPCIYNGLSTFREAYERFFVQRELPSCTVHTNLLKSMNVFTPFKQISPIKIPKKWTLPHVWKAILSGQIYYGECAGRYTDDYAYDASVDFGIGREKHLPTFALQLIENPSGWRVYPEKDEDDRIQLSVCCHSFDLNTLYFDLNCNCEESERRRIQRMDERQKEKAMLESLILAPEAIAEIAASDLLFDVEHLEMNHNTHRYETQKVLMHRNPLLNSESLHCRLIVSVSPHLMADTDLFDLTCDSVMKRNPRVIYTASEYVVTGNGLREILNDPMIAEHIQKIAVRRQTIDEFRKTLMDYESGRIRNLFHPVPQAYFTEALKRLDREEARIHGKA